MNQNIEKLEIELRTQKSEELKQAYRKAARSRR